MHHDLAEIDQYPLARIHTFDAVHGEPQRLELFLHVVGQRLGLAGRFAGHDDHVIKQRRHFPHVDHNDLAPFDIFERINGGFQNLIGFHSPPA